ncbi:MAG: type I secretion system permease/ATPase [Alteromonadaceae bacterium]|nr:type I secretion system permease/ATPase [Alteromonadaceae bacterium]
MGDHFKEAYRVCKQSLIAVAIFSGVANLLMLTPAFFMLNVYDKAVGSNSMDTLWVLTALTVFLFLILAAMDALRALVLVKVSGRLDQVLASPVYLKTFQTAATGGSQAATVQALSDLTALRQFITSAGIIALLDAPWLPIYVAVLFAFDSLLGWMGISAAIVFFGIAALNQKLSSVPLEAANAINRKSLAATARNLRNAEVASVMGMVPELHRRWRSEQDAAIDEQATASSLAGIFNAATKTLRMAVQSAAIAAGAYLVLQQEISPGMLIAGSILMGRALQPVEIAVSAWPGFLGAKEQFQRLGALLEVPGPAQQTLQLPPIKGKVEALNCTVAPSGRDTPVLTNISFSVPPGAVCAIIGASGSGKSSLVRGLLDLWPVLRGEFRIDGTKLQNFDQLSLGEQLGYLPQDIELLDGTVASNIARFGEIDSEAVIQAATDAGIHDFVMSLGSGYETQLGSEDGILSPGQRQRIALARSLYRRPKLVVLDEPNSNLDDAGEEALHKAIATLKAAGSTVLIVSHRQGALKLADYILALKAGQVRYFGESSVVLSQMHSDYTSQPVPHAATAPAKATHTSKAVPIPHQIPPSQTTKVT